MYAGTDIGEDALRAAALRHGFGAWSHHGNAQISTGRVGDVGVVAALPTTYMNRSGAAVAALARYYGLTAEQVVLLHDDLYLAVGRLKVKRGGSDGGHRGIRSTAASLRTDSFWRLRIGIGRPPDGVAVPAFVLQRFEDGECEACRRCLRRGCLAPRRAPRRRRRRGDDGRGGVFVSEQGGGGSRKVVGLFIQIHVKRRSEVFCRNEVWALTA